MKNVFVLFISLLLFVNVQSLQAQVKLKLGHINSTDLMEVMPGRDSAQKVLQEFAKSLDEQLTLMNNEFQTKYQDYMTNEATFLEPIKQMKQKELLDLQTRIDEFKTQAQDLLAKKETELVQPLIDKAKKAIDEVAVEKGYNYIFDTGTGALIYYQDSDDIMPFVKAKLGIQ
ncbi:MAG TPA: OmpH family outer membrane protein [Bacteroidales bacterium]|nr:OmpH family outer membrane protein [Bacteroidales bacterium]